MVQYDFSARYASLSSDEVWWVEHTDVLERHGYVLRPRFRPGWSASWRIKGTSYAFCEDAYPAMMKQIIDAIGIDDNKGVVIKRIKAGSDELPICQMLSTPECRKDPRNHAVPLLDYFINYKNTQEFFIVMPILRNFDDPSFETVDEVVDFIRQILEGLVFLHEMNVAHRDCTNLNIMMDPKSLYPGGFHPCWQDYTPDVAGIAEHISRRELLEKGREGVRYYFIDFGISTWARGATGSKCWVTGIYGRDQDVPELSNPGDRYDPFMVDIYTIGNMIKKTFVQKHAVLGFLRSLSTEMTERYPEMRPTAAEALESFEQLVSSEENSENSDKLEPFDRNSPPTDEYSEYVSRWKKDQVALQS